MDYLLYNPFSKWTWSAVSTISSHFPSNFPNRFALSISKNEYQCGYVPALILPLRWPMIGMRKRTLSMKRLTF